VRSANARTGRAKGKAVDDDVDARRGVFQALGWSPRDAMGFTIGALATTAILINVLFMQKGSHPAPMFKVAATVSRPAPAETARPRQGESAPPQLASASTAAVPAASAPPAPAAASAALAKAAAPPAPRTPGEIITEIQRELIRRGFYDGTIDGLYGPKTDSAIRDFEQAAGLKPSSEPNEALLQAMLRAPAKFAKGVTGATAVVRPPLPVRTEPVRNDPPRNDIARAEPARNDAPERPAAPNKRVIALQRALADFGYGQIKPTGVVDSDTRTAIEKFERERKIPITGQPSERVMLEMTAMTGRPIE